MTFLVCLYTFVILASQAHAFLSARDVSTLFLDAAGMTCPGEGFSTTSVYVQPVVFSAHYNVATIIDPFSNCDFITVSNPPADVVVSTLLTTTIFPDGQTPGPQYSTSCPTSSGPSLTGFPLLSGTRNPFNVDAQGQSGALKLQICSRAQTIPSQQRPQAVTRTAYLVQRYFRAALVVSALYLQDLGIPSIRMV